MKSKKWSIFSALSRNVSFPSLIPDKWQPGNKLLEVLIVGNYLLGKNSYLFLHEFKDKDKKKKVKKKESKRTKKWTILTIGSSKSRQTFTMIIRGQDK